MRGCGHSIPWCVAACPYSAIPKFAMAKSDGLLVGHTNNNYSPYYSFHAQDDVLATCWLDANVVTTGTNRSLVSLLDTRDWKTTANLQAPDGVTALRRVDEWRIVAAAKRSNVRFDVLSP